MSDQVESAAAEILAKIHPDTERLDKLERIGRLYAAIRGAAAMFDARPSHVLLACAGVCQHETLRDAIDALPEEK